ncbi:MAG: HD domain-containing protein [Lachnospiraceae bacterium]|nr:HD domain-containing protein [Lachnospiraceae bacterium]
MSNSHRSINIKKLRYAAIIAGIAVNVLLSFLAHCTGLPIYMDTIGTIGTAALTGVFPGIITAVATNVLCTIFNSDAIYFTFLNGIIAIVAAGYAKRHKVKRVVDVVLFAIAAGLITGIFSSFVQWGLKGGPQNPSVAVMTEAACAVNHLPAFSNFIFINIILNILDKSFSVLMVALIVHLLPLQIRLELSESGWRQKALSDRQISDIKKGSGEVKYSLRKRITVTLLVVSFTLVLTVGGVGVKLYYDNERAEKTRNAQCAARFAAEMVDTSKIDEYLEKGFNADGYEETLRMLYRIRENASGIEYLYLVKAEENGTRFIFDLEAESMTAYKPGQLVKYEPAFLPYLPKLLAGEEIDPIESDDASGWVISVYYPVKDDTGVTVCYACADVSLVSLWDFIKSLVIKLSLILLGFLMLVLAYGFSTTDTFMVFPISTIAAMLDKFDDEQKDQKTMDDNLKALRSIDICTGDEVEKLYRSICRMTQAQAEQLRSIRHLSDSTAKMQDGLIITMADMVESRDSDTGAHVQKTSAYVRIIAEGLVKKGYYAEKITPQFISDVVRSAPLHDVGKINISDKILNKPGKLTDEEYEIMKTHTLAGKEIMEKAIATVKGGSYLKEARNMAAYHHERWDGRGYPEGLHGEVIPLAARIMSVADVFDALSSPRVYKPAFPLDKCLDIIREGSGTQFDPKCVEVFIENLAEVKLILKKYNEDA